MRRNQQVLTATHIDAALPIIELTAIISGGKENRGAFEISVVDRSDPLWLFSAAKQLDLSY